MVIVILCHHVVIAFTSLLITFLFNYVCCECGLVYMHSLPSAPYYLSPNQKPPKNSET